MCVLVLYKSARDWRMPTSEESAGQGVLRRGAWALTLFHGNKLQAGGFSSQHLHADNGDFV